MNSFKHRIIILVCSIILINCDTKVDHKNNEPTDNKSITLKAVDYIKLGDAQKDDHYKAIQYFTKAIEVDSNSSEAFSSRAFQKQFLNDYDGALFDYNVAIKLDPNDCNSYMNRASILFNSMRFIEAENDYKNALIFSNNYKDSSTSYYNLGIVNNKFKNFKKAILLFTKSIDLHPGYLAYSNRAYSKSQLSDLRGAISDYDKSIDLYPYDGSTFYNRGICKIFLDKKDSGCLDLSKAGELGYDEAYDAIKDYCR